MTAVNVLLVVVILLAGLSFYFWLKLKGAESNEDVQPLDTGFIAWVALVFVFIVVMLFVYFGENPPSIPNDVGQVGDFIGGLTNPVLSFLALLVLLRTTRIQTLESRRVSKFMQGQQKLMEEERFENTFFNLLSQLEMHCEKHFRGIVGDKSTGRVISEKLCGKYKEFGELPKVEQLIAANDLVERVGSGTNCIILAQRAMRVVGLIANSRVPKGRRKAYANILRDTIYPDECIIIASYCFVHGDESARRMLKEWGVVDLNTGFFPCPEIEHYYYPSRLVVGNPEPQEEASSSDQSSS